MANEIPILTAFKGHTPVVRDMLINTIIRRSAILNMLPVIDVTTGFTLTEMENVTGVMGNVGFRALNEDYTDSNAEFRERKYGVKQLGGSMKIEKKVERQYPGTLLKQAQIRLMALGMFVDDKFFNGSTATSEKEFDGLARILGSTGDAYVQAGSGSGLVINTSSTTFETWLDTLDEAFRGINGDPTYIFMSDVVRDAFTSGARKMGADTLGTATDFLQRQVPAYRGVPLIAFGNNQAGSPILPFTETLEGGSTSSVYVVKLNEIDGVAGLSTSGIQLIPDEDNLFHRDVIDFDMGLKVTTNSAVRIGGVKVA